MNQFSRLILNGLMVLFLAAALYLVICTWAVDTTVTVVDDSYTLPVGGLLAIVLALVLGGLGCKFWEISAVSNRTARRSERQVERAEVTAEISSDKVKALEAKIETLEKALSKAIEQVSGKST